MDALGLEPCRSIFWAKQCKLPTLCTPGARPGIGLGQGGWEHPFIGW